MDVLSLFDMNPLPLAGEGRVRVMPNRSACAGIRESEYSRRRSSAEASSWSTGATAAHAGRQQPGETVPTEPLLTQLGDLLHHMRHVLILLQQPVDLGHRGAGT